MSVAGQKCGRDEAWWVDNVSLPRFLHPFYRLKKDEPSGLSE